MAIITKISCGLGNQMFQYAFGRSVAIKNKTLLKLDISEYKTDLLRKYELDKFSIQESIAEKSEIPLYGIRNINTIEHKTIKYILNFILNIFIYKILIHIVPGYVQEKNLAFDKKYKETKDNTYISGYRQSYKYFDDIEAIILKDFQAKKPLDTKNQEIVREMENTLSVGIHFRRGDYVTQVSFFKPNLVTCGLNYYNNARQYLEKHIKNPTYYIFSDDIERVKNNFNTHNKCIYIDWNKGDDAYKDMILMSKCKHNIIANSTFSWRSAWLNQNKDKIVICPKQWFNKAFLNKQAKDMMPKERIRI